MKIRIANLSVHGTIRRGWFCYELVTESGACWRLDTARRLDYLVGREVFVEGQPYGPGLMRLRDIEPLLPFDTDPDGNGLLDRFLKWLG